MFDSYIKPSTLISFTSSPLHCCTCLCTVHRCCSYHSSALRASLYHRTLHHTFFSNILMMHSPSLKCPAPQATSSSSSSFFSAEQLFKPHRRTSRGSRVGGGVKSTTVTHSSADWWDILLKQALTLRLHVHSPSSSSLGCGVAVADTILLQPVLSWTSSFVVPMALMSRLTQSIHFCFSLPRFLLPGGTIYAESFFRRILGLVWPHAHLHFFISVTSSFFTWEIVTGTVSILYTTAG